MAAVLQRDAEFGLDAAGAEAQVIALDEADHHAAFIRSAQINGAALGLQSGTECLCLVHADQSGTALQVAGIEHLRGGHRHRRGFSHVAVDVGKGQFHGLDLQVLGVDAVGALGAQVEPAQHAERHQRGNALAAGADFVHGVAAIADLDRLDPLGLVARQVAGAQRTPLGDDEAFDGLRDLALVEGRAVGGANAAQRARRGRKAEQLAHVRRPAPRQKGVGKAGLRRQLGRRQGPLALHHHRHSKTPLGDLDRGRQRVGQRQAAEALAQLHPGADAARHRHRIDAAPRRRHGVTVPAPEIVGRPGGRRAAGGVQPVQALAVPQDAEGIAAEAVADRLAHRHGGGRGHGGIDRIAALLQHAQPGLRRQRVRSGDQIAAEHRQARRGVARSVVEIHDKRRSFSARARHRRCAGAGAAATTTRPVPPLARRRPC